MYLVKSERGLPYGRPLILYILLIILLFSVIQLPLLWKVDIRNPLVLLALEAGNAYLRSKRFAFRRRQVSSRQKNRILSILT